MTCLEFRRLCGVDPDARSPEMLRHEADCASCAAHARESRRVGADLRAALRLRAPDGLEARILLRHRLERARRLRRVAVAAAVVAALVLAFLLVAGRPSAPTHVALAHVRAEADHGIGAPPIPEDEVRRVAGLVGAVLASPPDPVVYAARCGLEDRGEIAHLVLATPEGAVAVLLMPHERVARRVAGGEDGLLSVVLPAEHGAIAVVGSSVEGVARVEGWVRANVRL